jgi:uncharacterized OB-fold protein
MDRPIPVVDDDDTGGHFAAAQRGAIAVLRCADCHLPVHLPLPRCSSCGSWDVRWTDVAPRGQVYSYTVVTHPVHPAFEVPYTVALVALDDAPTVRLLAHLPGEPDLRIGQPVVADFHDVRDGTVVPQWVPG